MSSQHRNIGAYIDEKVGINPTNEGDSQTVNGTEIDRQGFLSGVLIAQSGTATGSPTAQSNTFKIQHRTDSDDSWSDFGSVSITLDGDDQFKSTDFDLSSAKQEIRVVLTTSLSDGSSPANDFAASVVLGGADELPASV